MPVTEPFEDVEMNKYEMVVPLDVTQLETFAEAQHALVETSARSICTHVDALDDDDVTYVTTQVGYDETALNDAFEADDVGIIDVQTVTELAIVDEESAE